MKIWNRVVKDDPPFGHGPNKQRRSVVTLLPLDTPFDLAELFNIACRAAEARGGELAATNRFELTVHNDTEVFDANGDPVFHGESGSMLRLTFDMVLP